LRTPIVKSASTLAGFSRAKSLNVLDGYYNPGTDVITDFVQIQTNGSDSELYVDTMNRDLWPRPTHRRDPRCHGPDRRSSACDSRDRHRSLNWPVRDVSS